MNFHNIDKWAVILVVVVSIQTTIISYLYAPKWKALMMTLPFPFVFATLSIGQEVDATSAAGFLLAMGFAHANRILHYTLRIPIIWTLVISCIGYCLVGSILASIIPKTSIFFWSVTALLFIVDGYFYRTTPLRAEQGHRTPLPVWLKLPIITLVIIGILSMKYVMEGFAATFPMLGVVTAYEARHSLWTVCRQMPVILLSMASLTSICRLTQSSLGLEASLALGCAGLLATLFFLLRNMWEKDKKKLINEQEISQVE